MWLSITAEINGSDGLGPVSGGFTVIRSQENVGLSLRDHPITITTWQTE